MSDYPWKLPQNVRMDAMREIKAAQREDEEARRAMCAENHQRIAEECAAREGSSDDEQA